MIKRFVETLMGIVKLLAEGNQIPEEYNPHSLKGNWKNYMECHIENDTLPCCHPIAHAVTS